MNMTVNWIIDALDWVWVHTVYPLLRLIPAIREAEIAAEMEEHGEDAIPEEDAEWMIRRNARLKLSAGA